MTSIGIRKKPIFYKTIKKTTSENSKFFINITLKVMGLENKYTYLSILTK